MSNSKAAAVGSQSRRRRLVAIALVVIGLVLVVAALYWWLHRGAPKTPPPPANIVNPDPFPSAPLGTNLRVKVAELGIDLPVVQGDGWTVPLFTAALYPGMKQPGQGDRSLLYAHAQTGMFGPLLSRGAVGQHVEVDRPGQPALHYQITTYTRVPPSDGQWLRSTGHEQVVLLTCTTYQPNDPRVIAVADPEPNG